MEMKKIVTLIKCNKVVNCKTTQQGITLVALVVTIILMLILAGIVLGLTIGEHGIIGKAQEAKKQQIISEAKEEIGIDIVSAQIEAIEKNEELEWQQVEDIIAKYGELQEDGDTIILKDTRYEISLSEIYTKNNVEILQPNKTLYQVSASIFSSAWSSSGQIMMPDNKNPYVIVGGRTIAGFISNKVTLSTNNKLTLPKGTYTFTSYVPTRSEAYGAGYKVFDSNGNMIVDHTYIATREDLASTNFQLEQSTDITIYWYRHNNTWIDLTYYVIEGT